MPESTTITVPSVKRFLVGQKYVFVRVHYENDGWYSVYLPWNHKLKFIETVTLTCTKHEKVAWDQDPDGEKKYDGFVFEDACGNEWTNQYPYASYGQVSDIADHLVVMDSDDTDVAFFWNVCIYLNDAASHVEYLKNSNDIEKAGLLEAHIADVITHVEKCNGFTVDKVVRWRIGDRTIWKHIIQEK